jgi:hypothetical protein
VVYDEVGSKGLLPARVPKLCRGCLEDLLLPCKRPRFRPSKHSIGLGWRGSVSSSSGKAEGGGLATVITSNRDTSDWLALFDDPLLGQSAVDRFRNNAYDLVIEGESCRGRLKPDVEKDGPPAPVVKVPRPSRRRRPKA